MKQTKSKSILTLLLLLPAFAIAQLSFEGIVKDKNTGTELEGALVTVKPLRINGAGYYSGKITQRDGTFKTSTNFNYPLQMVVTKKGCKTEIVKVKKDQNVTSYVIEMDCEQETIDQIILENTTDTDNDGVLDRDDECPEVAGAKENNGCPWPDADQDGVYDKDDACPQVAGVKEKQGCPITDRDEDGVNDDKDACPDEKGSAANGGCPDQPESIVSILKDARILFNFSGDQPIDNSDAFLNSLSELLKTYPYVTLEIHGFASNEGPAEFNQGLSERRAQTVKNALESLGVQGSRLTHVGKGENNPPFPNTSKENRAKNRSVVIAIK